MRTTYHLYVTSNETGKVVTHNITLDKQYATDWCKEWNEGPQGEFFTAQFDTVTKTENYDY